MGRRRTALLLGGAATAGGAAVAGSAVLAHRRWARADDPTRGSPLQLPEGREHRVTTGDGAVLAVLDLGGTDTGDIDIGDIGIGDIGIGDIGIGDDERDDARPLIVLAHGWTASRDVWAPVARRLLAAGHRVVVFDQRGHGASSVGSDGLTIEALGDDLCAVLEALDGHRAVVAGHSMGGMGAQMLALRHPDVLARRVEALVLISTAASKVVLSEALTPVTARLMAGPAVQRAMGMATVGSFLVRATHGRGVSLSVLDATRRTWLATPPDVRAGFLPALAHFDTTAELGQVRIPTVVVTGSRDTLLRPARSREIVRLIRGARLEVISGAGHQLPFEAPDRLAAILAAAADIVASPVREAAG